MVRSLDISLQNPELFSVIFNLEKMSVPNKSMCKCFVSTSKCYAKTRLAFRLDEDLFVLPKTYLYAKVCNFSRVVLV